MNKFIIPIIVVLLLVAGLLFISGPGDGPVRTNGESLIATIYKSPDCGCCAVYSEYLKREGYKIVIEEREDMDAVKEEFGVPMELQSCHTMVVGGYVIEGHIPSEAVDELLALKPVIDGIALPGMLSGSPGMPGPKHRAFEISSFVDGELLEIFITL